MKKLLLISVLTLSSCSFFESDYERLIKDVRAQKLKEKQQGIPNPVFEGITEPDFPNEEENNKTFEGVDANKDGIRDDIEIWINRISEDKEVRIATKHFYKMQYKFILDFRNNASPETNTKNLEKVSGSLFCLFKALGVNYKTYLNASHRSLDIDRQNFLINLFKNTKERNDYFNKSEYALFKGVLHTKKGEEYKDCSKENSLEYLKKEW